VPDAIRRRLLDAHRPVLECALSCADAVTAGWDDETTTDREAVVPPYETTLRRAGLLESLTLSFADSVTFAGYELQSRPVADVPYLAVTSRGVVLRGTVEDGRIVATLRAFELDPYRRAPGLPGALTVEKRE
jgi:hypothetical protein